MVTMPPGLPVRRVEGRFLFVSQDKADEDTNPDYTVITGVVKFTCSVKKLGVASQNLTVVPLAFEATFDSDGYLVPVGDTSETRGIELPVTDSDVYDRQGFTWRVDFNLRDAATGNAVKLDTFNIAVPSGEGALKLSELMPISESKGVAITRGEKGTGVLAVHATDGTLVVTFTDLTTSEVDFTAAIQNAVNFVTQAQVNGYVDTKLVEYSKKTATGYASSPAFIQDATLSPSPVDSRNLEVPTRKASKLIQEADLYTGEKRNLMQYTEDPSNLRWGGTATKTLADTIVRDGITLTRMSTSNFYHELSTNFSGNGMAPFIVGKRYLASFFAVGADTEKFFWMRNMANGSANGHGKRLLQSNRVTRYWALFQATTTSVLAPIHNPALGFGGLDANISGQKWFFQGNAEGNSLNMYVGGLQIEQVEDTALDGIAGIGDSTMQGSSGNNDAQASFEWMGYLEGLLNAETFNRGIGGNKLTDMDARWATDITPLKVSSKYVIIQGGINDIGNGATLAGVQASMNSLIGKAKTDGFIPVILTCTPFATGAIDPAKEAIRVAFNAWLKTIHGNVIDIASVIADPYDPKWIRRTPGGAAGWYGDGVHYTRKAKRAIAEAIAAWPGWDLPTPGPYQKVTAAGAPTPGGLVVVSPNGTRYRLAVADDGALTTTSF